ENVLGPEHPDVALSLDNLASLYTSQDRYTEAEPLYRRALAIREKVLGPQHPAVANNINGLAELYRAQNRNAEAEPLYKHALAIPERAVGSGPRDGARASITWHCSTPTRVAMRRPRRSTSARWRFMKRPSNRSTASSPTALTTWRGSTTLGAATLR